MAAGTAGDASSCAAAGSEGAADVAEMRAAAKAAEVVAALTRCHVCACDAVGVASVVCCWGCVGLTGRMRSVGPHAGLWFLGRTHPTVVVAD